MPPKKPKPPEAINPATVKAVEMHSHIQDEAGFALMRAERLSYALVVTDNPAVMALARKNSDLIGICVHVHPEKPDFLAPAKKAVAEYPDVVKGVKLLPVGKYGISRELLAPVWEFALKHNLQIQAHTENLRKLDSSLWLDAHRYRPLMEAFPLAKVLFLHGSPADETFELVNTFANAYVDTSFTAWGKKFAARALAFANMSKVVMGLDSPLGFPLDNNGTPLPHFRDAVKALCGFYGDSAAKVLYLNAEKLLGFPVMRR
jgi:predicted TIM-barrel fold metal-dependent hydrolase